MGRKCLGCQLANKEVPVWVVYENEWLTCILDHDPIERGHVLILPKKHTKEWVDMGDLITMEVVKTSKFISAVLQQLYQPKGITLLQNGGLNNDLSHFHFHLIPRKESTFPFQGTELVTECDLSEVQHEIKNAILLFAGKTNFLF